MSGGNISDGPSETSGNDTESNVVELKKKVPAGVGGYEDGGSSNPLQAQIKRMSEYHDREKRRWQDQNNVLSDKLRELRKEGQAKIELLRQMYEDQTEELNIARAKVDKYIERNMELEDKIEELEKQLA